MNDLRPVALTAVMMKTFERIILQHLKSVVPKDPFQFAYLQGRSVEDATLTFLHTLHEHLDKLKSYARVLFVDFSSAFNTIQIHILMEKLIKMGINSNIVLWIRSFLTDRFQYVRFKGEVSHTILINTGAPQGCVLSALLFTLYTHECKSSSDMCVTLKYADDTVIIGLLHKDRDTSDTSSYFDEIGRFHRWCDCNFLNLNVKKTKEMVFDFSKSPHVCPPVIINDEVVEVVNEYKYLGTIIDDKLTGETNVARICKKANQRMYFLRKLRDINMDKTIMNLFYKSIVQSVVSFCILCWYGNLTCRDQKKLNRIVKSAKRLGCTDVMSFHVLYQDLAVNKVNNLMKDQDHILCKHYQLLPSRARLSSIYCRTSRYKNSFVPTSIRTFNGSTL